MSDATIFLYFLAWVTKSKIGLCRSVDFKGLEPQKRKADLVVVSGGGAADAEVQGDGIIGPCLSSTPDISLPTLMTFY